MAMRNRTLLSAIGDLGINLVVRGTHRVDECYASVIESPEGWGGVRGRQSGGPSILPYLQTRKNSILARVDRRKLDVDDNHHAKILAFSFALCGIAQTRGPWRHATWNLSRSGTGTGTGTGTWGLAPRVWGCGQLDCPRPFRAVDQTCAAAAMDRTTGLGTGLHDDAMTVPTQPRESGTQRQCHRSVGS